MSTEAQRPAAGRPVARAARLLRDRSGEQRVTNIELFFDLVYVFAVTQLSHYLLREPTVGGALRTALLLGLVWLVWSYTTWVTNWLDPERMAVRLLLVALMRGGHRRLRRSRPPWPVRLSPHPPGDGGRRHRRGGRR